MVANRATAVFAALGDDTRRAILDDLRAGSRRARDITDGFPVSRQAVGKHLRVLEAAGLVRATRSGRERHYQLDPAPLRDADAWLATFRIFWANRLVALKRHVERNADRKRGTP